MFIYSIYSLLAVQGKMRKKRIFGSVSFKFDNECLRAAMNFKLICLILLFLAVQFGVHRLASDISLWLPSFLWFLSKSAHCITIYLISTMWLSGLHYSTVPTETVNDSFENHSNIYFF